MKAPDRRSKRADDPFDCPASITVLESGASRRSWANARYCSRVGLPNSAPCFCQCDSKPRLDAKPIMRKRGSLRFDAFDPWFDGELRVDAPRVEEPLDASTGALADARVTIDRDDEAFARAELFDARVELNNGIKAPSKAMTTAIAFFLPSDGR